MADPYISSSSSELLRGMMTSPSEALSLATSWLDGHSAFGGDDASSSSSSSSSSSPVEDAIALLIELRDRISRGGLISDNEAYDDVPTSTLELLDAEYQLGRAFLMLPTRATNTTTTYDDDDASSYSNSSVRRRRNVMRAMEHYVSFLRRLAMLGEGMLEDAALAECRRLLDDEEGGEGGEGEEGEGECEYGYDDDGGGGGVGVERRTTTRTNPSEVREMKIQRHRRKRTAEERRSRLTSLLDRRGRLGLDDEESMEGHDAESLMRNIHVETLRLHAEMCMEEIQSSRGELEMLDMAIKMSTTTTTTGGGGEDPRTNDDAGGRSDERRRGPLRMTQITKNPITGRLELATKRVTNDGRLVPAAPLTTSDNIVTRDAIASGVFRPGWNQPTMTLEELGERELADAMRRSEIQRISEANDIYRPRRYDQLERDGMEDDDALVEASAKLDREWDDWKEENPRGSGNKMGERGDRNF
ncbi:hypothetical protein ACHAW5_002867 [Stephanodiscus triporus]|uniref:TAP42-like protein n=1 Tax=Stephanodiscus triporus TaxID=2934178 RepID=A0ABD3P8V6_9STRA